MDPALRTCSADVEDSHGAVAESDCGYRAQQLGAGVQNTLALDASATFQRTIQHGQVVLPSYVRRHLAQTLRIGAGSAHGQKYSAKRSFARLATQRNAQ